jgi:putative oxidoreductase
MSSPAASLPQTVVRLYSTGARWIDSIQPVFALALRVYVAQVFFFSGLTKLRDWSLTVALFTNEYHVPVLSPELAAALGASAEIGLPILLVAGLGARPASVALFIFNIVAVISYPDLSDAGVKDHMLWGALLLVTFVYGPGKLSVDHWLGRRYGAAETPDRR